MSTRLIASTIIHLLPNSDTLNVVLFPCADQDIYSKMGII